VFVITMLLRRRPDLSPEEFHRYWREHHGPLAVSFAEASGIRRYVQLHGARSVVADTLVAQRGCAPADWDGIALVFFDSEAAAIAAASTPEGQEAPAVLLEDERKFLDLPRCELFVTEAEWFIE
jgi:uncharacterized protein (TIGR02118 family)